MIDANETRYYLLDVGREKYGDCILAVFPGATVLIDGGHPGDYADTSNSARIPSQLTDILGPPPFHISLLVVTHCHSDHIGCLPDLVKNGDPRVEWALVHDEDLGFGTAGAGGDALSGASDTVKRIVAALSQEPHGHLVGAELDQFMSDAVALKQRYADMLKALEGGGTKVVRYCKDDLRDLLNTFAGIGLDVLGPTKDQVVACSEAIAQNQRNAVGAASDALSADASPSPVDVFRSLIRESEGADAARPTSGAPFNDTSIVLKLGSPGGVALFAGDMQFADPMVPGIETMMASLLGDVAAAGPYDLIKTCHHTSDNGLNSSVFTALGGAPFFGHSGGQQDTGHPNPSALAVLASHQAQLTFGRTDRNGIVSYTPGAGMQPEHGDLNDFTPNAGRGATPPQALVAAPAAGAVQGATGPAPAFRSSVRVPCGDQAVTITYEVGATPEPRLGAAAGPPAPVDRPEPPGATLPEVLWPYRNAKLAGGRPLPGLLFVTNTQRLALNIGAQECALAVKMIKDVGQTLLDIDIPWNWRIPAQHHIPGTYKGVVIVGGYDVLAAQRLDVLTPQLRAALGSSAAQDPDQFIVWSDSFYGDVDGDGHAEVPVSRIPDARSSHLVLATLSSVGPAKPPTRFGERNSQRPFADVIWAVVPGAGSMLTSGPTTASQVGAANVDKSYAYFMLHGSDTDSTRYWGEVPGLVEAFNVACVPGHFSGVVFAGCCWGALSAQKTAYQWTSGPIAPKAADASIALSFLLRGGLAYVGCTGVHYSPDASAGFFGGPMHRAFWNNLANKNLAPAPALFQARIDYLAGMPHGQNSPFGQAVERKIMCEFTCLGLGW